MTETLSDKINKKGTYMDIPKFIYEKDIKQFIKDLKEEMPYEREVIDKLAGDKLTK